LKPFLANRAGQLQGIPEILRHNRKSLRANRTKAAAILCAFSVAVGSDVIDAIYATLPGKKKAKVRTFSHTPSPLTSRASCTRRSSARPKFHFRQALEKTFKEVLGVLGDRDTSTGDDTDEDSDEDHTIG
jgi:hypothetical protein